MGRATNKFKFEGFTKKIAKVGGERAIFKKELGGQKHDEETFFAEALAKWVELDHGSHFKTFLHDIPTRELGTYAQVLYYQKRIMEALLKHLAIERTTATFALLELCMALAKDLREEFYQHMWQLFHQLITIMEYAGNNVELLETTHLAMALLFKQHWKLVIKELRKTFDHFAPLFGSTKQYIRRFAAEAFAFLLRKTSSIEKFFTFLIDKAYRLQDEHFCDGVAMLIFNTIRGVNGGFHSCTDQLLNDMLRALFTINDISTREIGTSIFERAVAYCLLYAKNDHFSTISAILTKTLSTKVDSHLFYVALRIVTAATAEVKKKILFSHRDELIALLKETLATTWIRIDHNLLGLLSVIVNRLYNSEKWCHELKCVFDNLAKHEQASDSSVITFIESVSNIGYFDLYILPAVGVIIEKVIKSTEGELISRCLQFYANLCNNRRPLDEVMDRKIRKTFFDVSKHGSIRDLVNSNLTRMTTNKLDLMDINSKDSQLTLGQSLIIWPWLTNNDDALVGQQEVCTLIGELTSIKVPLTTEMSYIRCQLLFLASSALYQVNSSLLKSIDEESVIELVRQHSSIESAIRFYHLYVMSRGMRRDLDGLDQALPLVSSAFTSPSTSVRISALEICASFAVPLEERLDSDDGKPLIETSNENMFALLASIEKEPASSNIRDRLRKFRAISYGNHLHTIPRGRVKQTEAIFLQIGLAQFFHQFTPLWSGMHEILITYAKGLHIDIFWKEIETMLNNALLGLRKDQFKPAKTALATLIPDVDSRSRTDYSAIIEQILKFLQKVPEIAERRTKTLSPFFLEFFSKDYMNSQKSRIAAEKDVVELAKKAEALEMVEDMNSDETNEQEGVETMDVSEDVETLLDKEARPNGEESFGKDAQNVLTKPRARRILIAFLDLFASFRGPKVLFRQSEIYAVYNELLLSFDADLQKAALKCICAYKFKWLTPYKDNLNSLLDKKTFRNELANFSIGSENSIINSDHVNEFLPILLRLLYGRLIAPSAKMGHSHRLVIVRFLAGCSEEHLDHFISLLFHPFLKIFGSGEQCLVEIGEHIDDETIKQHFNYKDISTTLETIENVLKGIAQKLNQKQRLLIYQLLISIMVVLQRAAVSSQEEQELKMVKSLRKLVLDKLRQFILAFAHCEWSADQVKSLWKWAVIPYSEVVEFQGRTLTVAISSVLGIIAAIAQMPRIFHLLCAHLLINEVSTCPLKIMIDSLLWDKTVPRYVNMIRLGLVSMIEFADETPESIPDIEYVPIISRDGVNYGTSLLVTQMDSLLEYIASTLEKPSNSVVNNDNLKILNGVSPFIESNAIAKRFTFCLVQLLERKNIGTKPDTVRNLLATLGKIVPNLEDPSEVYLKLPKFFAIYENRLTRQSLSMVCEQLAENNRCSSIDIEILNCLHDIESWNPKRLEEPDFDVRAAGYSRLTKLYRSVTTAPHLYLLSAVAQSSAHTISTVDDIALRAQASLNLRDLIEFLGTSIFYTREVFYIIDHQLLPLVIRGFKQEQQNIRDEFIRALHVLVCAFPNHPHLSQIGKVKDENPDDDFFENAVHIQIGRRRAGFKILSERINSGQVVIPAQILVAYFIPLLRHYMLDVTEKMSSVSDAALELLISIMKKTPWKTYIKLLDHFINKLAQDLDNEKAFIRIVCAILDAFHFEANDHDDSPNVKVLKTTTDEIEIMEVDEENEDMDDIPSTQHLSNQTEKTLDQEVSPLIVYEKVVKNLLPKLKMAVNGKLNPKAKDVHKLALDSGQKHYQEDDDIRRAPITLAAIKVLLQMPSVIISHNLHGVIMKLVELLVARSDRVRETARKVMSQVVIELGPHYFPFVIKEMKHVMQRGYQVHVLIFTTHMLINVMRDQLKPGDLDTCLDVIMQLCCDDLFYSASEEKEVEAIRARVPEAKAKRTMDTIESIGRFIGTKSLRIVLDPLYEVIESKPTAKVIKSIGELLRHLAIGVKDNAGIEHDNLLIFCHQLLSEHVEKMIVVQTKSFEEELNPKVKPESCLIIPKEPRRLGQISKHSLKSRSHVFVEYALQLLAFMLQNKKFDPSSIEDVKRLDPFISILAQCLALKYDKVTSLSLRCAYRMLPYPLPTLHSNTKSLCERLFVILADYSALGNAGNKHTVLELNQLLFKTFDGLLKISSSALLDAQHIELLLNYVETDVLDSAKQATAFALLKTIISKGIEHPMLPGVIKLLREQAIISEFPHVQAQCRLVVAAFVGQHPQSRSPKREIEWWLEQLEYEHEGGRLSAAEMLNLFFANFLSSVLEEVSLICLVKIGSRLVNDPLPKCRRFCALSIKTLLNHVGEGSRNEAFVACSDWLKTDKEGNYAVAAGILVQLAHVEEERFLPRAILAIDYLTEILNKEGVLDTFSENTILTILDALTAILQYCKPQKDDFMDQIINLLSMLNSFCRCMQEMEEVRRASSELIGQCLSIIDPDTLCSISCPSPINICDWMTFQLRGTKLSEATAQQAIKNLLFLCGFLKNFDQWKKIVEQISRVAHFEIRKLPEQAIRRIFLFKFCAALCMKCKDDSERVDWIINCFMPSITREILRKSAKNTDELFDMATQVGEVLKTLVGEASYAEYLTKFTRTITDKTEERKIQKKEKVLLNPDQAIKDRQKKYKKKSEAKKRKIDVWKPYRVSKRKHMEELRAQGSDEDL